MITSAEKRLHPRVTCSLNFTGEIGPARLLGVITDLSLGGMRIKTPGAIGIGTPFRFDFQLPLSDASISVNSVAVNERSASSEQRGYGCRIDSIKPRDAKLVKQFVLDQLSIHHRQLIQKVFKHLGSSTIRPFDEREKVRDLLSQACRQELLFTIVQEDKSQAVQCKLLSVGEAFLEFACSDDYASRTFSLDRPVILGFSKDYSSYHFETLLRQVCDRSLQIEIPKLVFFSEKRARQREAVTSTESATVEIPLPYPPGAVIQRQVLDLSSNGVSFKTPAEPNVFLPGTPLRQIRILSQGRKVVDEPAEVRHISPIPDEGGRSALKVGLEFGIQGRHPLHREPEIRRDGRTGLDRRSVERRKGERRRQGAGEQLLRNLSQITRRWATQGLQLYRNRVLGNPAPEPIDQVEVVTYANPRNEELVGILNTTFGSRERKTAPVVIIPPAFGRRKESTGYLALTLVENFKRLGRDVVVLRYDGIRSIGESFKDRHCRFDGKEMVNMTMGQGVEDILSTLDYVSDNPRFEPSDVILVSFSLAACMARQALVRDAGRRVNYWISAWGAPDAQEIIRNSTGGLDYIGNFQRGVSCGLAHALGHLINTDRFCADAIREGMAFLEEAKRDMARIDIPVTWMYGKFDDWINPERVRDIMNIRAGGPRELIELPTGHMPTTNEEALETYQLITRHIWRYVFLEDVEVQRPPSANAVQLRNAEWSRTPRLRVQDQARYWQDYLLGQGDRELGFDVMVEANEYQEFMAKQIELLDIRDGETIGDLGAGTGLFHEMLFKNVHLRRALSITNKRVPRIKTIDLVEPALDKARRRVALAVRTHEINPTAFEFVCADLEVSRLKPIQRFLQGEYYSVLKLKGKIEGLPNHFVDLCARDYSEFLHSVLRGKKVTGPDLRSLRRMFSDAHVECLLDLNLAARFVLQQLVPADLAGPRQLQPLSRHTGLDYSRLTADLLNFKCLNFRSSSLEMSLPLATQEFDKILASIVLSYLFNPEESLGEFYRALKPGGSLVLSTFRPDMDISRIYMALVLKIENDPQYCPPAGMTREAFLAAVRAFSNSAAFLLRLEEEGHFRFFSREELKILLENAGFSRVSIYESFGQPAQAYIAVGIK
ncbi:MAG: PilZ domain-containing protein [Acidobacteriota bacterium]